MQYTGSGNYKVSESFQRCKWNNVAFSLLYNLFLFNDKEVVWEQQNMIL